MSIAIDEIIKAKLQKTDHDIPDSYYDRIEETIEKLNSYSDIKSNIISAKKQKKKSKYYKMARAAILSVIILAGSVSTYAAVNLYMQRMNAIPEESAKKYYDDVQNNRDIDADSFSRPLTESENELMISLREKYIEQGLFPQKELIQYENSADVKGRELYFVANESRYYLPERSLSEEEILEIIDFQEKRDISVRKQNEIHEERTENESKKEYHDVIDQPEKQAMTSVADLYEIDENELSVVDSKEYDNIIEYTIKGNNSEFSVYYLDKKQPYRIICNKDNLSAHTDGLKITKDEISSLSDIAEKKAVLFTGKKIVSKSMYSHVDESGDPATGTISIYCKMKDGSGCVAVYSLAYGDVYDIYTLDDADLFGDMIKERKLKAEKRGNEYKKL